jgi:hypothetical protein
MATGCEVYVDPQPRGMSSKASMICLRVAHKDSRKKNNEHTTLWGGGGGSGTGGLTGMALPTAVSSPPKLGATSKWLVIEHRQHCHL